MGKLVQVLYDQDEINERCKQAREEFEENCRFYYGMVPFTEEYLSLCWPKEKA